ncbi:phosphotransferase [Acidiphilium sp.]|uniref:phosphotransferase n=1 Tax=Acidiphilium sp. TaxID=527 RepID=UPI00258A4A5B|nr:phosphotransferase [Acidiphilium sp.]
MSPHPEDQRRVIAFLSRPESHGLATGTVERIETHCSIVFLAGPHAFKLKRAIRYSALDYTTPAARRAACEAELVLNRRTAPTLYLTVRAITRDEKGHLAFDGPGAAVDHVVVMRRFDQSDLFDAMAARDALTPALMRELGAAIARFHLAAESRPDHGGSEAIERVIAANERELALTARTLDGAAVDTLSRHARATLAGLAPLLDWRRSSGRVRRCHGDLRLANICLFGGRPTMFDCIEFSDEIGCIDLLYDLAFLLMDLELRGRRDLANAVFNAHADVAPDAMGLRAMPLFLALRAATRSYALAGGARRQTDPARALLLAAQARRHVAAGLDFLAPARPCVIAVGGGGADRSHRAAACAGRAAPAPGARIVRPDAAGDAAWHEAAETLAAGCSVVIDAAFGDEATRARALALATAHAAPFEGLWSLGPVPPDAAAWRPPDAAKRTSP